ncbi:MAG: hypothetical protein E7136_08935 [Rikenellaceae bacterium]|nr:hypothetical protein [Rikenellaceae bacterium]
MKKIFYLASIAALAFSSCAKDDTTQAELGTVTGGSKITAAMGNDTRTYLDENKEFRWEGTDAIAVYNDNAAARMNGTQFKMTEGDKSTVAVFNGPALNTKYNHLAVYPWTQQKAFTDVVWEKKQVPGKPNNTEAYMPKFTATDDETMGAVQTIKMTIPATQEYYPGTFGNGVVPAISSVFTIAEDGSADVSMQPVADYLFVDIQSVEPIKNLTLKLKVNGSWANISGTGYLKNYLLNGNIRYSLPELTENTEDYIKLVTNERAPEVSCHEANTYVFVVPAGILGANKNVLAYLYVNDAQTYTFAANGTDSEDGKTVDNKHLKYKLKDPKGKDEESNRVYRQLDDETEYKNQTIAAYNMKMENGIFYMNKKNSNGEIVPFVYNPENTYIIEHEGHLLQYLTEYGNSGEALNKYPQDKNFGFRNAIICAEHEFDFSKSHIEDMSDLLDKDEYSRFERYFSAYLNGSFPVIEYGNGNTTYKNTFSGVEFGGKTPEITGIYQPLAGMNGIFGTITTDAAVSNVSFSGIKAKVADKDQYNRGYYYYGLVLGSVDGGSISNVTIDNATGMAILNKANNAAYNNLTVTNAENLNFIALDMDLTADLEIKNWAEVSVVSNKVFGSLMAELKDGDYHHVVKLPATANYSDLSLVVGNSYSRDNIEKYVSGLSTFRAVAANQADDKVVSVLVGETSVWTGDKFHLNETSYKNLDGKSKVAPATFKAGDKIGDINVAGWYKIEYAEQAATGGLAATNGVLMRNMELGYAVNAWDMVTMNKLHGNDKKISNVYMAIDGVEAEFEAAPNWQKFDSNKNGSLDTEKEYKKYTEAYDAWEAKYYDDLNDYTNTGFAPLNAKEVRNLTVEGVTLDIYTEDGAVVPGSIGGLTLSADRIYNVAVTDLVITGDGYGKNDEQYIDEAPVFIGWLVANTTNATIENSTVAVKENTIKGYAGLVGKLTLTDNAGANIKNSSAVVAKAVQTELDACTEELWADWAEASYSCTPVAYVKNVSGVETTINMKGSGVPAFVFYAPAGDPIYVINDGESLQLKNNTAWYGNYSWSF